MMIALERDTLGGSRTRYDVYDVPDGEYHDIDDLVFVRTLDALPANVVRLNGGVPPKSNYVATYRLH